MTSIGQARDRSVGADPMAGVKAYGIIKLSILDGRFPAGSRLKENELTELCGMSRTPVREALRRLASEGLVVVTPNVGAEVCSLAAAELEEVYTLRGMVESYAAQRAASRIAPAALERLIQLASLMEQAVRSGAAGISRDFAPANAEFHHIILDAAASPRLSSMASLVIEIPLTLLTLSRYSQQDLRRSLHHHREVIEALQARDGVWASSVMKSHVHAAYQALARQPAEVRQPRSRPRVA